MSKTETSTMTTTAVYSDDKTHRYLLRKEWDNTLPEAMVLMLSPSISDTVAVDRTTMLVLENVERLHYGKVSIVNLFSALNGRRTESELDDENLAYITEAAERAQGIIYAVGTGGDGSKTVLKQQRDILNLLIPWQDKMQCIVDANGKKFYHPLCPTVHRWRLEDFEYSELKAFKECENAETTNDFQEVTEPQKAAQQELQEVQEPPKRGRKRRKHQSPNE
ncbi:MAG: DUF1643 domain-containing protein [Lachnospiraceae bacterium]|nr:DUF1643 domain-containing protein [Ruminococcus sp.]MCM1275360.1 DUF1643 domain-containing protein [Lachnospiraceae bacterium]